MFQCFQVLKRIYFCFHGAIYIPYFVESIMEKLKLELMMKLEHVVYQQIAAGFPTSGYNEHMLDNGNINVPYNARLSGEIVEGFCRKLDVQYGTV